MKVFKAVLVIIVLISLYLFVRTVNPQQIITSLHQIGYSFFLLLFITFLAYLLGTIGWKYCLGPTGKHLSISELFLIRHVGETVGLVNPTSVIGGEAVKIFLLRNKGLERKTVVASVVISRAIMVVTQLLLFTLAAVYLLWHATSMDWQIPRINAGFYVGIVVFITVAILALRQSRLRSAFRQTKLGYVIAERTRKLRQQGNEVQGELALFYREHRRALLWAGLFFSLHWIAGSLEFYFILVFLGIKCTVIQALLVDMGIIFFKAAGAFIPGQLGMEEYGNKVMLATIGVAGATTWVTASILRRTRQLFWIAFGLVTYLFMQKKWSTLLHES